MKINPLIYVVLGVVVLTGLFFIFKPETTPTVTQSDQPITDNKQVVATKTVVMKADNFEPANFTIQKNTKVVFQNEDSKDRWPASAIHPIHSIYSEFDPKKGIKPGEEWSFVFDKVGDWQFHDHLNPSLRGTIKVNESI